MSRHLSGIFSTSEHEEAEGMTMSLLRSKWGKSDTTRTNAKWTANINLLLIVNGTYSHIKLPCGMSWSARTPQPFLLVLKSWSLVLEDGQHICLHTHVHRARWSTHIKSKLRHITSQPHLCKIVTKRHLNSASSHSCTTTEVVGIKTVSKAAADIWIFLPINSVCFTDKNKYQLLSKYRCSFFHQCSAADTFIINICLKHFFKCVHALRWSLNTWVHFALRGSYRSSSRSTRGYTRRWEEAPPGRIQVEDDHSEHDKNTWIQIYILRTPCSHTFVCPLIPMKLLHILPEQQRMVRPSRHHSLPCRTSSAGWAVHTCRYLSSSLPYKHSTVGRG